MRIKESINQARGALLFIFMDESTHFNHKAEEKLSDEIKFLQIRITELEKAESRHKLSEWENEQKLRALFDQTFQFIGLMTPDGTLIEANRTALEFSGITAESVLNKPFWETPWWTHSPSMQEKLRQSIKKAANGEFVRFEATHLDKDANVHYVDFSIKPVKDGTGKVIFLIPEGRDITELKKASDELSRCDERYATLVNDLPVGIYRNTPGPEGYFLEANPAIVKMFEAQSKEELLKHKVSELYQNPAEREVMSEKILEQGAVKNEELQLVTFKGNKIWVLLNAVAKKDAQGSVYFDGIMEDITERKKYEERLREARAELAIRVKVRTAELSRTNEELRKEIEERKKLNEAFRQNKNFLSNVFNSIQDGISVLDKDMNILLVNPFMEKLYADKVPFIGKKCYETYQCSKQPCKNCPVRTSLNTQQLAAEIVPKRGENGEIIGWLELYSFPLFDQENKELLGAIEYVRDITDKKAAQERVGVLNEELLRSNKRLRQLALTDSHTGLYNHRYLQDVIEAEFHRAKRYDHPLAVIMLDIDYFKSINDVYGHQFGDLVLKQFARQLKMMMRRYDIIIRSGGEEFIIISPGIDIAKALSVSQRIFNAVHLYRFGDKKHTVTLKLSLATVSYPENKVNRGMGLVNLADQILSKVKESGGNRVYSSLDIGKGRRPASKEKNKPLDVKLLQGRIDKLTKKSNQSLVEAIFAFAKAIELKDHYTGEHAEDTVRYVTEICNKLALPKDEIELIKQGAVLHDLGKIGISEKILLKKARLTKREFDEIKKHPQIGADILRPIQFLRNLIPLVLYHHEKWDGSGYPSGINGEEIPIGARIIAIADAYQALTSDRPYRKAYSKQKAMKIMQEGSGRHFDPKIVGLFLKILQAKK
ncbi:MAG: diguanylate cyclase [Candidatus Omnitrophica bacterium]|nr:diguanylate cyclase [Candidatus Omnitrophota bacterium]